MNINKIKLIDGYLITKQGKEERETKGGILVVENEGDFLVHAEVVNSGVDEYPVGTRIVYHVLDSQDFRDGADSYSLVHKTNVRGTYEREN